ncbi:MAG: adenosylmethionine decarboxylase [Azovibrio sp.]
MNGLHLIADLYRCQCLPDIVLDRTALEEICVQECQEGGLTPLGAYFYQFVHTDGQQAGVTGTVVLAESHLAIHTWPESGDVTLDVYVCNFSRDNSDRARQIFNRIITLLDPEESACQEVLRGHLTVEA